MDINELIKAMEQELGSEPETMVLLSKLDSKSVLEHVTNKKFAMEGEHIPPKYKLLMSIAISAALGAEGCMETYTKVAKKKALQPTKSEKQLCLQDL